jgi:hypothetical protein
LVVVEIETDWRFGLDFAVVHQMAGFLPSTALTRGFLGGADPDSAAGDWVQMQERERHERAEEPKNLRCRQNREEREERSDDRYCWSRWRR